MSMKKEFHPYCVMFPQATLRELHDMSDDIATNGLKEDIILYDGMILDGRNRYLACEIAKIDPCFVEYDEEEHGDPLQYVISKNLYRRHLQESQRAFVAQSVYEMMRKNGVKGVTLDKMAKQFNVSPRAIDTAIAVKKSASDSMKNEVQDGTLRLGMANNAIKQAMKETGIKTPKTPEEKKQLAEKADSIRKDKVPPPKPTEEKTESEKFNDAVLSGEFNGKKFRANIKEMQTFITTFEKMPLLYHDNFELCETLDQEATLNNIIGALCDSAKRVESQMQRKERTDLTEVIGFVADVVSEPFPGIRDDFVKMLTGLVKKHHPQFEDDFGVDAKRELNEQLKDKIISDCNKYVAEAEKIRAQLRGKYNETEPE